MFDIRKFSISLHWVAAGYGFYCPTLAAPEAEAELQGFSGNTYCRFDGKNMLLSALARGKTAPGFAGVIPGQVQYHCKMALVYEGSSTTPTPFYTAPAQKFLCIDPTNVKIPVWLKAEEMTSGHRLFSQREASLRCAEIIHTPIEVFSIKTAPGFSWSLVVKYGDNLDFTYVPMPPSCTLETKRFEEKEALVRTTLEAEERGAYESLASLEKMMLKEAKTKSKQQKAATLNATVKQLADKRTEETGYRAQIADAETGASNVFYTWAKDLHAWAKESAKQAKTIATLTEIAQASIQSKLEMAEKLAEAEKNQKGSWF